MSDAVFVTNVSDLVERQHIEELFGAFGAITACALVGAGDARTATVVFADAAAAQSAALLLDQTPLGDKVICTNRPRHSLCTAYLLWLCGGWFGLHLIYLERFGQTTQYFYQPLYSTVLSTA
jgi:hypothetical protein